MAAHTFSSLVALDVNQNSSRWASSCALVSGVGLVQGTGCLRRLSLRWDNGLVDVVGRLGGRGAEEVLARAGGEATSWIRSASGDGEGPEEMLCLEQPQP